MIIQKINESYLTIKNLEYDESLFLSESFSFYADNYRFHPSYKMKRWDGKIRLYNRANSTLPIGCYNKLIELLDNANMRYKVVNDNKIDIKVSEDGIKEFLNGTLKCDLTLRDCQTEAILDLLMKNRGVGVLPTAAGKSLVQYTIINYLILKGYVNKVLLVVPKVGLVNQMEYDFVDYAKTENYKNYVHKIYSGMEKETDKPIVISTWQSLKDLNDNWFEQFDLVMIDECHEATAKVLSNIVLSCTNAKFKYGVSGTLEDSKVHEMQLMSLFGDIKQYTTTKSLMEEGQLTNIKIYNMVLKYDEEHKKQFNDIVRRIKSNKTENSGAKAYKAENDFIADNKDRKKFILKSLKKCNGNCIVLFKNVEYGKELCELASKYLDRNVYFVYGKLTPNEKERIRQIMEHEEDAIVFATLSIFSTGINIKKLKYLMFVQNTKSKIKVMQSIGRVLRKHVSKECAYFIDIIDDINGKNFSVKHAIEKLELYTREGHEYKIKEYKL